MKALRVDEEEEEEGRGGEKGLEREPDEQIKRSNKLHPVNY